MYKILGVQKSKGEYNGHNYDNIKFHCSCKVSNEHLVGEQVETISVTRVFYEEFIVLAFSELVGKSANIFFDKKGKVIVFDVLPDKK